MKCRKISIANHKGGVGKTVTSINLSACLAKRDRKVLLIDLDPQANATIGLDFEPEELPYTIFDCMGASSQIPIDKVMFNSSLKNLWLAPSSIKFAGFEYELAKQHGREGILTQIIAEVISKFDYIIFDCPPSLGLLTINGLRASNEVIIPLQSHFFSLRAIEQFMETVDLIRKNLNHALKVHILFTMVEVRTKLSQEVIGEIKRHFGRSVFKTIIRKNVSLSEATSYGIPIINYNPYSTGAKGYISLAKEVIKGE
ncbi:Sporulation initiation inhibitor protein Soj [subsurface metagenome]